MDLFKYTAAIKQLETAPTIKELHTLMRKYESATKSYIFSSIPIESQILNYKLLTYSLKLHKSRSKATLPDFIQNKANNFQSEFLEHILENDSPYKISYAQLIDVFEFNSKITIPYQYAGSNCMQNLNAIVGTNPIHFSINWIHIKPNPFEKYSLNDDLTNRTKLYISGLRYRQVNFPDSKQTVLESYLEYLRPSKEDLQDIQETIQADKLLLSQQISALEELANESI